MPKMLAANLGPSDLYQALKAQGFELPEECASVELLTPVDGLYQLRMTVNVYGERLEQIGRAISKIGEETR